MAMRLSARLRPLSASVISRIRKVRGGPAIKMEIKADAAQAAQSFLRVAVESERARLILELAEKARRSIGGGWEELSKGNYILESLGVKMADETENLAYEILGDEGSEACCPRCGKPYEDFSDLGCGYCDSRSAEWGIE